MSPILIVSKEHLFELMVTLQLVICRATGNISNQINVVESKVQNSPANCRKVEV